VASAAGFEGTTGSAGETACGLRGPLGFCGFAISKPSAISCRLSAWSVLIKPRA